MIYYKKNKVYVLKNNVNNKMEIETENNQLFDKIKFNYYEIKKLLHTFLSFLIILEDDLYLTNKDISRFLNIHNIMDLSYIFRQYYLLNHHHILESAYHILQKSVITDDILNEDLFIYTKAYILIKINDEPHKHEELFDYILEISRYHTEYINGTLQNLINSIEFEESFHDLSI